MGEAEEFRCFIGGLAWATTDRSLRDAFEKFGHLVEARVAVDKFSGRSRGFGFVTFDEKKSMEEAIEEMHGLDLDGRSINVEKAQPNQGGSGRDRDDRSRDRGDRDRDRGRDRSSRDFGGGRGSGGGGDCFKCGKPGHFARECPVEGGGGGGRYGGSRDDRYGGGRDGGRDGGGRDDRYSGGEDGGRGSRSGPDRNGDRYGGRSKDSAGGDRHSRDRSAPYERRSSSGYRG